jgi:hypothetical protein
MARAYLLLKVQPGAERQVWLALGALSGGHGAKIVDVLFVVGEWDAVLQLEGSTDDMLRKVFDVRDKLGRQQLIIDTMTYVASSGSFSVAELREAIDDAHDESGQPLEEGIRDQLKMQLSRAESDGLVSFAEFQKLLQLPQSSLEKLLRSLRRPTIGP